MTLVVEKWGTSKGRCGFGLGRCHKRGESQKMPRSATDMADPPEPSCCWTALASSVAVEVFQCKTGSGATDAGRAASIPISCGSNVAIHRVNCRVYSFSCPMVVAVVHTSELSKVVTFLVSVALIRRQGFANAPCPFSCMTEWIPVNE